MRLLQTARARGFAMRDLADGAGAYGLRGLAVAQRGRAEDGYLRGLRKLENLDHVGERHGD